MTTLLLHTAPWAMLCPCQGAAVTRFMYWGKCSIGDHNPTPPEEESGFFLQWTPWSTMAVLGQSPASPSRKQGTPSWGAGLALVLSILPGFTVR